MLQKIFFIFFIFTLSSGAWGNKNTNNATLQGLVLELGLKPSLLKKESLLLNNYLKHKITQKKYCQKSSLSEMCLFFKTLHSHKSPKKKKPQKKTVKRKKIKGTLSLKNIKSNQKISLQYLEKQIYKVTSTQLLASYEKKLKRKRSCPANFSYMLIDRIQELLPSIQAKKAIVDLYQQVIFCHKSFSKEELSMLQYKMGLFSLVWKNPKKADSFFKLAASHSSEDSPQHDEKLFWGGLALKNQNHLSNPYWKKLKKKYPASFHVIEAVNRDDGSPIALVKKRKIIIPNNKIKGKYKESKSIQKAIAMTHLMMELNYKKTALKLAYKIIKHTHHKLSLENIYFLNLLARSYLEAQDFIPFSWYALKKSPKSLNVQWLKTLYPLPHKKYFLQKKIKIDPNLLYAVARQESLFNLKAKSSANAHGLLQLLPSTAKSLNNNIKANLYDPKTNVFLGSEYLAQLAKRYDSLVEVVAAYNAGPSRVDRWKKRYPNADPLVFMALIPFKETRTYAKKVLRNYYWYRQLYKKQKKRGLASSPAKEE